jgi:hypothetical protein
MRLRTVHISIALAAAILLMMAFMAAGAVLVSMLSALLAAGLVAWIAYRVACNVLARRGADAALSHGRQSSVP